MRRSLERLIGKLLSGLTLLVLAAALVLAVATVWAPHPPELPASLKAPIHSNPERQPIPEDEAVARLGAARMSRKITAKPNVQQKPAVPKLDTLIRVKGIMDFGKVEENEAIIEDLRSTTTGAYRVGQKLKGIDALVEKVDSRVTFNYDGQAVTLGVWTVEQVDGAGLASPEDALQLGAGQ